MSGAGEIERVHSLQHEVRQAGAATRTLRDLLLAWLTVVPLFLYLAQVVAIWHASGYRHPDGRPTPPVVFQRAYEVTTTRFAGTIVFAIGGSLLAAALYRRARENRLRRRLAALSPQGIGAILRPLQEDDLKTTRRIAGSLRRRLHAVSELAPAPPPAGRGSEVSAGHEE